MATNQQRRDAHRARLQRQIDQRRAGDERRRKITLIASIGATLVLIAAIVIVIVVATSGNGKQAPAASGAGAGGCAAPPTGSTASFQGVTVSNPTDLKSKPKVVSHGQADPTALECMDLVVGSGPAATSSSSVAVQYVGELYKKGTEFDASWDHPGGKPVPFSLSGVVEGFRDGIGGTKTISAMKVGGRRILILPSALGYGSTGGGSAVPPNTSLVFVVDLTALS